MDKILLTEITKQFRLDLYGIHGIPHWSRVQYFGLKIAESENARSDVVRLFSVLHDSQRFIDGYDPDHGMRAVNYAKELRNKLFEIDDAGFELLCEAMAGHSDGKTIASDVTVLTCWDADRLDLTRLGVRPLSDLLCTQTAKQPDLIKRAWNMNAKNNSDLK
jgi:uncharacterized protein